MRISVVLPLQLESAVLGGEQVLKRGYPEASVEIFLVFEMFINIDRGEVGAGGLRGLGLRRGCL